MPAAPAIEHFCDTHREARAGWQCTACGKLRCPDCVGDKRLRQGSATLCLDCGGLATKITRPRRIEPYWEMFPRFLAAMFSWEGLVQMLAIGGFMYLLSWLPFGLGAVAVGFVYITYYFRVISHAAAGGERLPEPEDFLGWESIFSPMLRFSVAAGLIWLPAVLYIWFGVGYEAIIAKRTAALLDPVIFILLAAGLVYFPAAIIAAAVANSVWAVINPMITVRLMLRIPWEYAITWAIWAGLSVLDIILRAGLNLAASVVSIPIVSAVIVQTTSLFVPVFTGLILGRLIYQNADEFGLLLAGHDVEEVWPEAVARGQIGLETRGVDKRAHVEPVPVAGWDAQVPPAPEPPPDVRMPMPSAHPAPWAPIPGGALHGELELDLEPSAAPAPLAPAAGLELWGDSADDATVATHGAGWLEDAGGDGTELDLEPLGAVAPALPLADDLELDLPRVGFGPGAQGALLTAAQLGPQGELRPGSGEAAPATPSSALPVEVAAAVPVLVGSRLHQPPGAHGPEPEAPDDVRLREALERGDEAATLRSFRPRSDGRYPVLGPRLELRLAGILERDGAHHEAVKACRRAVADEPRGSFAPRALYMGGRILSERLADPAGARVLWEHLVRAFPHEQLAELARAALARLA